MAKTTFTGAAVAALLGAGALLGCADNNGSGEAKGNLFIKDCHIFPGGDAESWGSLEQPRLFDLQPEFLAGQPIEDISGGVRENRLVVRMQRTKRQLEANDVVAFDIVQTYAVARCLRGRILPNGTPDYDQRMCYWAPGATRPRLRVGLGQAIGANLIPRVTCSKNVVGTAISSDGRTGEDWESWIEFDQFGRAEQPEKVPAQRDGVPVDFKVEFGERVHASAFEIKLIDDRVAKSTRLMTGFSESEIVGKLTGWLDFDLQRGRSAQPFP